MRLFSDLGHQRAQQHAEMRLLVPAFAIGQRRQGLPGAVSEHGSLLQVIDRQGHHGKPLLNGFKGLQPEVTETKDFFELQVIDFHGPTRREKFQGCRGGQRTCTVPKVDFKAFARLTETFGTFILIVVNRITDKVN